MAPPPPDPKQIAALREALTFSPDNVPLRLHVADLLMAARHYEDAEAEYRRALKYEPENQRVLLGLAKSFHAQGKNELALVVFEEQLLTLSDASPEARVEYARLLIAVGRSGDAVAAYREAMAEDPEARAADIEEKLGIGADPRYSDLVDGRLRSEDHEDDPAAGAEDLERPKEDFATVGGMDHVKDEIRMKIILPLTNKDLYAAYGKKIGGGILMYGPPGCGKTHLARATAGEIRSTFLSVGLHDILDMWIGQSERHLHELFEQARAAAPCVLFFDEVDALAASRADLRRQAGRQLINQFLSELDGLDARNDGVLILAATNAPWHLDPAFRRPGRFDRILFVPPPDLPARESILRIHLAGKPQEDLDLRKVAEKLEGYSGADLKAVVDRAVEEVLREAMKKGRPLPLSTKGLLASAKGVLPSTKEWFATARNHALFANEAGQYDDVLQYLKIKK